MLKYAFAGILLLGLATPVFAQEFYVVQDPGTKKCMIVDKKPETKTVVIVGDGVFKTRTEAETAQKKIVVCTQ